MAADKWQLRLFMIASPLRTEDPYKGYIQILGGESELFWAIMSSTPELRTQNWEAWKQALPYWAEWYAGCALIETAGPMWKVLTALTEVEDLPVKIVRETITRAVQHESSSTSTLPSFFVRFVSPVHPSATSASCRSEGLSRRHYHST